MNENVRCVQQTDEQCLTLVCPCPLKWAKTTATIHREKKKKKKLNTAHSESAQVQYKHAFFKESIKNIN